jgi:hypothetical protein
MYHSLNVATAVLVVVALAVPSTTFVSNFAVVAVVVVELVEVVVVMVFPSFLVRLTYFSFSPFF